MSAGQRDTLRIGAGLGFYGDSWHPARASLERGNLDYLVSDHLSELTLAILQKDRKQDASLGYARDLLPMMSELWPLRDRPNGRATRFISNAGGLNPMGAAGAVATMLRQRGWHARIAVVTGDDVLDALPAWSSDGRLETMNDCGAYEQVQHLLQFANAYIGAKAIVAALALDADIVITGRAADASLFLAPAAFEFGWDLLDTHPSNLNHLAAGIVAGHLLECSGQVTGGNFGGLDWAQHGSLLNIGYPIAQVASDGRVVISKPGATGGRVDIDTVREQLLYEVHDPHHYFTPDVVVDMGRISLKQLADDQVEVSGCEGKPAPTHLKVVGALDAGWMGQASIMYAWPQALEKARYADQMIRARINELGWSEDHVLTEFVGVNAILGGMSQKVEYEHEEVGLRMAIRTRHRARADAFARLFPTLALSGPPFVAGRMASHPASQLLSTWSVSVPRDLVEARVNIECMEV